MSSSTVAIAFGTIGIDAIMDIITADNAGTNLAIHSNRTGDIARATYTATNLISYTVWEFGQCSGDHAEIYSDTRTLIHISQSAESIRALTAVLSTTGGFLLEDDGDDDNQWRAIQPTEKHELSPRAQLALDVAEILGAKAAENLRPLFTNVENLRKLAIAINRRLNATDIPGR